MMPMSNKRYQNFLNNYEFFPNSIGFRIHSCKAIEHWKNVQSFQLNQILNGRFYFSQDRREILLLKYDMWSRWLYEVENLCIELSGDHTSELISEGDLESFISLSNKTAKKYTDIMLNEYKEHFDLKFVEIWLKTHEYAYEYLKSGIRKCIGLDYINAFTKITNYLIEVMQYTLTEIHELNNIFHAIKTNDDLFLVVTPLALKCKKETDLCLLEKRFCIYKENFDIKEIYLKNYTDELIPQEIIDRLELHGVTINFRKSIIN